MEIREYKRLDSKLNDLVNSLKFGTGVVITLKKNPNLESFSPNKIEGHVYDITDNYIQTRYSKYPFSFLDGLINWAGRVKTNYNLIEDIQIIPGDSVKFIK